jgi:hypothetical protein
MSKPKTDYESMVRVYAKQLARFRDEREEAIKILKGACDRDWSKDSDMSLCGVATIAANGLHWRNERIRELEGGKS